MPLREEKLLKKIISGCLFCYVQCDIEEPENLRGAFAYIPPVFKNNKIGRDVLDSFMKVYAEKEGLLIQPSIMPISNNFLDN